MLAGGTKQLCRSLATAMATVAVLSAAAPLSCCCDAYSCAADTTALLLQVAGLGALVQVHRCHPTVRAAIQVQVQASRVC
jgi:hypothetical protein